MVGALVPAGCASGGGNGPANFDSPFDIVDERARVEVENGNWSDLDIWVIADNGGRHRLGHVPTGQTQSFSFDLKQLGQAREFRLLADQVGGRVILSPYVFLRGGDVAEWDVAFHPSNSRIFVRRSD